MRGDADRAPTGVQRRFAALGAKFDHPDILRRPTDEVLTRFRAGGDGLVLLWWAFAMSAALLAPVAVLLAGALHGANDTLRVLGAAFGVLAAVVQFLGLIRWPFLVPYIARVAADPDASPARREAVDVVFQAFNRYLGVAVGEHLGYLFSGAWSILVGVALTQTTEAPAWLGIPGMVIGALLVLCSLEFLGRFAARSARARYRIVHPEMIPVAERHRKRFRRLRRWRGRPEHPDVSKQGEVLPEACRRSGVAQFTQARPVAPL